jgi:hypothetical protein
MADLIIGGIHQDFIEDLQECGGVLHISDRYELIVGNGILVRKYLYTMRLVELS